MNTINIPNTAEKDIYIFRIKEILSGRLRSIRKRVKISNNLYKNKILSQEKFSEKIGVNSNTYKSWENESDTRMPEISTLYATIENIKSVFNMECTFGDLLDEEPPKNKNIEYIVNKTGLDEKSAEILMRKNTINAQVLNEILRNEKLIGLLYMYLFNANPSDDTIVNISSTGDVKVDKGLLGGNGLNIQGDKLLNVLLPEIQDCLMEIRKKRYSKKKNKRDLTYENKKLAKEIYANKKEIKRLEVEGNGNNSDSKE